MVKGQAQDDDRLTTTSTTTSSWLSVSHGGGAWAAFTCRPVGAFRESPLPLRRLTPGTLRYQCWSKGQRGWLGGRRFGGEGRQVSRASNTMSYCDLPRATGLHTWRRNMDANDNMQPASTRGSAAAPRTF